MFFCPTFAPPLHPHLYPQLLFYAFYTLFPGIKKACKTSQFWPFCKPFAIPLQHHCNTTAIKHLKRYTTKKKPLQYHCNSHSNTPQKPQKNHPKTSFYPIHTSSAPQTHPKRAIRFPMQFSTKPPQRPSHQTLTPLSHTPPHRAFRYTACKYTFVKKFA